MQITAGVNAGLAIQTRDTRILLDAIHKVPIPKMGFSAVTPERWQELQEHPAFARPDIMTCTHTHPDHYSKGMTQEAVELWSEAIVWMPPEPIQHGETKISFHPLTHEHPYEKQPNYGVLVEDGEVRILAAGDCSVASPEMVRLLETLGQLDGIVLAFPWLTTPKGSAFIDTYIPQTEMMLIFNHLPLEEDDIYHYRSAAKRVHATRPQAVLFTEMFQTVSLHRT